MRGVGGSGGTTVGLGGTSTPASSGSVATGGSAGAGNASSSSTAASGGASGSCSDGVVNQEETAVDCGGTRCAPCTCRFGTPEMLNDPNYPGNRLWSPSLMADELTLYFGVEVVGTSEQLAFATRSDRTSAFGLGQSVPGPVGLGTEGTPYILPDGMTLYFYSTRAGGAGARDLYVSTRSSRALQFASVQALVELNTDGIEHLPWVSAEQRTIYFTRIPAGQSNADIWRATRANTTAPFGTAAPVTELNSGLPEDRVTLTADQRVVILGSRRAGGPMQLYQAVRATTGESFGTPQAIAELASSGSDYNPALTPDGSRIYFTSTRNGSNYQIWHSSRVCP